MTDYLGELRETHDSINEFVDSSHANHGNYAHAAGAMTSILLDAIMYLPRAKRGAMRERLYRLAQDQKNAQVMKQLQKVS